MAAWMAEAPRDREAAHQEQADFAHHADRMHDPDTRQLGFPIGAGRIEGVAKTRVKPRFAGSGMRGSQEGAKPWARSEPSRIPVGRTRSGPRDPSPNRHDEWPKRPITKVGHTHHWGCASFRTPGRGGLSRVKVPSGGWRHTYR